MEKTIEEILESHCPSMNNLYLDKQGRAFRDRILLAMKDYAEQKLNKHDVCRSCARHANLNNARYCSGCGDYLYT